MPHYRLENETLNSRRGKYSLVNLPNNPVIWIPDPLDYQVPRHKDVVEEVSYAQLGKLSTHKYWQNEPKSFIFQYQNFYRELFSLDWLYNNDDRHSLVINKDCCLTLVQYHNHRLIAYSRSTDMRNGYYSDKLLLDHLAQHISTHRPDCKVETIEWYLAIPHVYQEKGIARLKKDEGTE